MERPALAIDAQNQNPSVRVRRADGLLHKGDIFRMSLCNMTSSVGFVFGSHSKIRNVSSDHRISPL